MADKVAFIIPGYSFEAENEPYTEVGEMFESRGIEPEYVEINWQHDLSKNIEQAREIIEDKLKQYDDPEIYLFGHSWGAVCAFVVSPEFEPEAQILASLSPHFEEDWDLIPKYEKILGDIGSFVLTKTGIWDFPRQKEFEKPSFEPLIEEDLGELCFLYAEREYEGWFGINKFGWGNKVAENRKKLFPEAHEIVVPDATHWMTSEAYLSSIEKVVNELG